MMHRKADVIAAAVRVLDANGLAGCSMRQVAAELGLQVSALYHHVANKQTLLALMADEILAPLRDDTAQPTALRPEDVRDWCGTARACLLAVRDGAEVVATATAFRLGGSHLEATLATALDPVGARTLALYLIAHAQSTDLALQAQAAGALESPQHAADLDREFLGGVDIILRGCGGAASHAG